MDSSEFGTSRPQRPNQNDDEENEVIPFENEEIIDDNVVDSEEEGEDLQGDDMFHTDYQAIPELDRYDTRGVDDGDVDEDEDGARRRAEMALDRREDRDNRGGAGRDELLYDPADDEELEDRDRADRAMDYRAVTEKPEKSEKMLNSGCF